MALKSAWEISQEKAAAIDGRKEEEIALTDKQKAEISEVRKEFEAKVAEREVMLRQRLGMVDPEEGRALREEFQREKKAIMEQMEARVEKIRKGV
jgi:hypothetical protein